MPKFKDNFVHSQATKAHRAAEVQLPCFLLSAPSRLDAGAHWREDPVIPRAYLAVLQTRKYLLPTDIQSTDRPARSQVIILIYVRVDLLLHEVQGAHKVFSWLQTFITRKLSRIQTFF
jgi:hypothetical protein